LKSEMKSQGETTIVNRYVQAETILGEYRAETLLMLFIIKNNART